MGALHSMGRSSVLGRTLGYSALVLQLGACSSGPGGGFVSRSGSGTESATSDPHVQAPSRSSHDDPGECPSCGTFRCTVPGQAGEVSDITLKSGPDGRCGLAGTLLFACGGKVLAAGVTAGTWTPTGDGFTLRSPAGDLICLPGKTQSPPRDGK